MSENGVALRLQDSLVELIDLALHAKQAHWNVVGPSFRPLHTEFDEITDIARLAADAVAERLAALDVSPDGTPAAVAGSRLEPFPLGRLPGHRGSRGDAGPARSAGTREPHPHRGHP